MSPPDRARLDSTLHIGLFFDGTRNNADNLQRASRPPGATTPAPRKVQSCYSSPFSH